ncbi:MAG: lytic transglycosylase domain-containing protein [Acidobacteriota bacterium]|nr:lytic transglycosylase domain-containing protein [Acidobacteriota bacterium]MDH3529328.1 lytic transglycosylase domain-containing protein [Acidobacteriota bacterium]
MASNSIKTDQIPDRRAERVAPLPPKRNGGSFKLRESNDRNSEPGSYKNTGRERDHGDEWVRERTLDELKTIIQAIQLGVTDDWKLTDLVFYARHPELKGTPLTADHQHLLDEWNSISALLVHPAINELNNLESSGGLIEFSDIGPDFSDSLRAASANRIDAGSLSAYTTLYDDVIANATEWCPGLSPAILKSLLAQESAFNPTVINKYGYAGIAQFGRPAAREVGLNVGIAGTRSDERLDPEKAIPGAARLLNIKAQRLTATAFARYGRPTGIEFWKFVTAAYNGGEGTVALAMGHAYRLGLSKAREQDLAGPAAVSFARNFASKWENLKVGGMNSPLGLAASRYFPSIAAQKYSEIGNYPSQIVARVAGSYR